MLSFIVRMRALNRQRMLPSCICEQQAPSAATHCAAAVPAVTSVAKQGQTADVTCVQLRRVRQKFQQHHTRTARLHRHVLPVLGAPACRRAMWAAHSCGGGASSWSARHHRAAPGLAAMLAAMRRLVPAGFQHAAQRTTADLLAEIALPIAAHISVDSRQRGWQQRISKASRSSSGYSTCDCAARPPEPAQGQGQGQQRQRQQ